VPEWAFESLSRKETSELTHCYHQYPAKFIPQLARALLKKYTRPCDVVWDPFCGSGTLILEAFRLKRNSIGTDVNPTATLISRTKSTPLNPSILKEANENLFELIKANKPEDKSFYMAEGILNGNLPVLEQWFSEVHLLKLSHILYSIKQSGAVKSIIWSFFCELQKS